jgi:GT2 family glycosyltransferase
MISVIVINYKKPDLTKRCIDSIIKHADYPFEIILVDNSSDYTYDLDGIKYLPQNENLGFVKAVNMAVDYTEGKYILLVNNDAVICDKFFSLYVNNYDENTGVIGAIKLFTENTDFIEGSCFFISKELFINYNKFDEIYGIGTFEDVDLCKKILNDGYELKHIPFPFFHRHATTFGEQEKERITEINRKLFIKKWEEIESNDKSYVDVICVNYKNNELTKDCLSRFIKNIDYKTKILLINNETEENDTSFEQFKKETTNKYLLEFNILNSPENLGFLGATNKGYTLTSGKYIILLNNDAMCNSPFIKNYVNNYKNNVGIIGASKLFTEGIMFLEDSMTFFSREFRDIVLGDMETYFGMGIMEDVLYSYKTIYVGYKNLHIQFDYHHIGGQSTSTDKKLKLTEENRAKYREMVFDVKSERYKKLHSELKESIRRLNNGK